MFDRSLNIASIFLWDISPGGTALNSSLLYVYLLN